MTHTAPREDAERIDGRPYVRTVYGQKAGNTTWVHDWREFKKAGGGMCFSEDQTEITLTLPAGVKFSIRFQDDQ